MSGSFWARIFFRGVLAAVIFYAGIAYLMLPALWRHYEHHPAMEHAPKTTQTKDGRLADPLNVALIGTQAEVVHAGLPRLRIKRPLPRRRGGVS